VEIEKRSADFDEVKFQYESRKTNVDAHLLAKNSIYEQFGRRVWYVEPPEHVSLSVQVE
jgi:hypothetical protein